MDIHRVTFSPGLRHGSVRVAATGLAHAVAALP
jgi:hypothetical protein